MTQATGRNYNLKAFGDDAIPAAGKRPLSAAVVPFKFWGLGQNPSGYVVAQAAGVTNLISVGLAERDEAAGTASGDAGIVLRQQEFSGLANSTGTLDAILDSDYCVASWWADNATIGKKSNYASVNRSMAGLALGIDPDNNTPIVIHGPVGWMLARLAHMADNVLFGQHLYIVDGGAGTDLTEIQFSQPRAKLHGVITSIEFIANATLAADATNYKTLTVTKYAADGSTPVVVGTMTTVLVTTKWVAKAFTLSAVAGALDVLEGDTFTIQNSHAVSGAITPAGVIRINGKVG